METGNQWDTLPTTNPLGSASWQTCNAGYYYTLPCSASVSIAGKTRRSTFLHRLVPAFCSPGAFTCVDLRFINQAYPLQAGLCLHVGKQSNGAWLLRLKADREKRPPATL